MMLTMGLREFAERHNAETERAKQAALVTLRDEFAKKALPVVIDMCRADTIGSTPYPEYVARRAYEMADAMIIERTRKAK